MSRLELIRVEGSRIGGCKSVSIAPLGLSVGDGDSMKPRLRSTVGAGRTINSQCMHRGQDM